jgi:hypothetical protein
VGSVTALRDHFHPGDRGLLIFDTLEGVDDSSLPRPTRLLQWPRDSPISMALPSSRMASNGRRPPTMFAWLLKEDRILDSPDSINRTSRR